LKAPGRTDVLEVDITSARAAKAFAEMRANGSPVDELRVLQTDAGASGGSLTVPTTVATSIYAYMTASVAMRRIGSTVFRTDAGNAMVSRGSPPIRSQLRLQARPL
jgi:hypothetical protein